LDIFSIFSRYFKFICCINHISTHLGSIYPAALHAQVRVDHVVALLKLRQSQDKLHQSVDKLRWSFGHSVDKRQWHSKAEPCIRAISSWLFRRRVPVAIWYCSQPLANTPRRFEFPFMSLAHNASINTTWLRRATASSANSTAGPWCGYA